ncbi:MAG: hypothetical protein AAF558_02975, partial [Verrucomicrobiota bacterium]
MIDGFLVEDLVVLGSLDRSGYVTKGFRLALPDVFHSCVSVLNQWEDEFRILLRSIDPESRLQIRLTFESSYVDELLSYYNDTCSFSATDSVETFRNATYVRFSELSEYSPKRSSLRRAVLHLYVSRPLTLPSWNRSRQCSSWYRAAVDSAQDSFGEVKTALRETALRLGGSAEELSSTDLFCQFDRFFNPSVRSLSSSERELRFDPAGSILENCLLSAPSPTIDPGGFLLDNHYHSLIALRTLPRQTYSGMMRELCSLPFSDYEITLNLAPLDPEEEIAKVESSSAKLRRALASHPGGRMEEGLKVERAHLERLSSNETLPFSFNLIVRTWGHDSEQVIAQSAAISSAISRLQGAKPYLASLPTTARDYFEATLPGFPFRKRQPHWLTTEDPILANLLPLSASPSGNLQKAEALYLGAHANLIGIRSYTEGLPNHQWPKHLLVCGKTGSGKSTLIENLLVQTSPFSEFTVIVDTGRSLESLARGLGAQPFIVKPDAGITLNYLDTQAGPLTADHLSQATALVLLLTSTPKESPERSRLASLISESLWRFYSDCFRTWRTRHPQRYARVIKAAWRYEQSRKGTAAVSSPDEQILGRFAHAPENEELLLRIGFTAFHREEFPTHSSFHDWLVLESMGESARAKELAQLAHALQPWRKDSGCFGAILDGPSTFSFAHSVIYLELGEIPDSTPELKAIVSFLLLNSISNEIRRRPRDQRKRIVFEELNHFLTLPGASEIVAELFERSRKLSTWCIALTQGIQSLGRTKLAARIFGNLKTALLLKQTDPAEIAELAHRFALPEAAQESLTRFSDPSEENGAPFL